MSSPPTPAPPVELEKFNPSWRLICAFTSIAIVNLACALDATTIGVALPIISTALHGTAVQALWTGTAFLLASTVWQPVYVAFSDVFGRRPLMLFALVLFTVGAVMCAVSHNFTVMLTGRVIQGCGVGGINALTTVIITDLIPLRERGNYIALISIVWAIGTVSGPLVGGAFAQRDAWRWIFWLNLPIVVIGFVGVGFFLNLGLKERSLDEKLSEIDFLGAFIFVASSTSLLIPISWGGSMYPWSSWHTLVPLILGAVGLLVFISHQIYFGSLSRPEGKRMKTLLPMKMFTNRSTSIAYMVIFLHGTVLWSIVYYMPLYFQSAKLFSPLRTGVSALPQTLTVVPMAVVVGVVASKTGHYRWSLYMGWAISVLGVGLLYLLEVGTSTVKWVFFLLISGIGIGLLFPGMSLSIQASAPQKDIAIAAGLVTFFRAAGQSFGVAIGEAIFQNRLTSILSPYQNLSSSAVDAVTIVRTMATLPPNSPVLLVLKHAFADSIKTIWAVMCGISGLALIATFGLKEYKLDQALGGEQGFIDRAKTNVVAEDGRIDEKCQKSLPPSVGESEKPMELLVPRN